MVKGAIRRSADRGLQPERTSLAWFRTYLGFGAVPLVLLKVRYDDFYTIPRLFLIAFLCGVAFILFWTAYGRHDVDTDVVDPLIVGSARTKLTIALSVLGLIALAALPHLGFD